MSFKNLSTNEIFAVLNHIKQKVGLAVCDFTNNQTSRNESIRNMEKRFYKIVEIIHHYFNDKKVKNKIKIQLELKHTSDINYWNNKFNLETLKIDLAHKFEIPIKCIKIKIVH